MNNLQWITKNYSSYRSNADVSINYLNKNNRNYVSIILRNECYKLISDDDYIMCAIDGYKLYLKGTTDNLGYKLGKKTKGGSKTVQIYNKDILTFGKYNQGDYDLLYDKKRKLYYIDTDLDISD